MDAAIAALLGAAIGAIGSVGGVWLQQRHQTRRELLKTASDLAIEDYGRMYARTEKRGGDVPPISVYVAYHASVLRAIAEDQFNAETIKQIENEQLAIFGSLPRRS